MPAKKGNKYALGNRGGGRVTDYRPEFADIAHRVALLGATDEELAGILGVGETTVYAWKLKHQDFAESLKKGKADADARVAQSLFRRAIGWRHKATRIFPETKFHRHLEIDVVENFPPDTVAAIFWLKNRRPQDWRDKQTIEHQGEPFVGGVNVYVDGEKVASTSTPGA